MRMLLLVAVLKKKTELRYVTGPVSVMTGSLQLVTVVAAFVGSRQTDEQSREHGEHERLQERHEEFEDAEQRGADDADAGDGAPHAGREARCRRDQGHDPQEHEVPGDHWAIGGLPATVRRAADEVERLALQRD